MLSKATQRFALLYAWIMICILLLLTPMPFAGESDGITWLDKIVHAFIFGILAYGTYYNLRNDSGQIVINPDKAHKIRKKSKAKADSTKDILIVYLFTFIFTASFSYILENAQINIPGRTPDILDFISSLVGTLIALLIIYEKEK